MTSYLKILLTTIALLVAAPQGAHAVTLISGKTGLPMGRPWTTWVSQMQVPTVPGNVTVHLVTNGDQTPCNTPGTTFYGCATDGNIWIVDTIRLVDQQQVLRHELGHEVQYMWLDSGPAPASVVSTFEAEYGLNPTVNAGDSQGTEWFAETYRLCSDFGTAKAIPLPGGTPLSAIGSSPQETAGEEYVRWNHSHVLTTNYYDFPGYADPDKMAAVCAALVSM